MKRCNGCGTPLRVSEQTICSVCQGWQRSSTGRTFTRNQPAGGRMGLPPKRIRRFVP